MEIIIHMEDKENPIIGATLREMASNHWIETFLPQLVQAAKEGKTRKAISICVRESTAKLIEESFSKLGIKVKPQCHYPKDQAYAELVFSWFNETIT